MSLIRGRRYNRAEKANDGSRGNQYLGKDQNDTCLLTTAERLAKQLGVSPATIKRDGLLIVVYATIIGLGMPQFYAGS